MIKCVIENCLKTRAKGHPHSRRVCTAQNTYCQIHTSLNGAGKDRAVVVLWEVAGGNGISTRYGISNVPHGRAGGGRTCIRIGKGSLHYVYLQLFVYVYI